MSTIVIRNIPDEIRDGFSGIPVNPNPDTNPRCEVSAGNIRIDVRRADARRVAELLAPGRVGEEVYPQISQIAQITRTGSEG